ncbi:MAG: hypothetical protein QOI26_2026 [Pseudonocardiales bacterium]|nr:hypothetical protein [Pseudonocardiales bacterium]
MSAPRLRPRVLAAGLGLTATVSVLAGCAKPQPSITVLSDNRSQIVRAQPACMVLGSCQPVQSRVPQVAATGGSQILVDVPRELADGGWIVAAFTSDGKTNTALTTPGAASPPIRGRHSVRLQVPAATEGGYYLQITALRPSNQLTTWLLGVQLRQ